MNKGFFKGLITGIALTVVFALVLTVGAEALKTKLDVVYRDIKVLVDGKKIDCRNGKGEDVEPFIVVEEGTTYVPLRSFTEAVGIKVEWDDETSTIYLGEKPSTVKIVSAADFTPYYGSKFENGGEFTFKQKKLYTQNALDGSRGGAGCYILLDKKYSKFVAKAFCPDNSGGGFINIYDGENRDKDPIYAIKAKDGLKQFGEIVDIEVDVSDLTTIYISCSGCTISDAYFVSKGDN